ncbi:MAG: hypothetical protein SVT52_08435 [Planctomycetota bacterium]|nr:hypothetical protein [Planctomycetota bacterium]
MKTASKALIVIFCILPFTAASYAEHTGALEKMPIRSVAVFKDGHAFVVHQGQMPTDAEGCVVLDRLPNPVLGTFWVVCNRKDAPLRSVVASRRKVMVEQTVMDMMELLKANVGAKVIVTKHNHLHYQCTIVGVPARSSEELQAADPAGGEKLPQEGKIVLLETTEGVKAMPLSAITNITFLDEYTTVRSHAEFRNRLTLNLDWPKDHAEHADVSMMYLQKGLRWIPSYKVDIDGRGKAVLKLQATLVNDLADLEDATVQLVIGVPTFAFKDMTDPIALQQVAAEVARRQGRRRGREQFDLSNAIASQRMTMGASFDRRPRAPEQPEVTGSRGQEDLFVFTVEHVTLRKGQRMVLPVQTFQLEYRDVYTLDIPITPPPEVWRHFNSNQLAQLASLTARSPVLHQLRLKNSSEAPLTTAPALIIRDGQVLGQGLMKYTPIGSEVDLPITQAVDVKVDKQDKETGRNPEAVGWNNHTYGRVDLTGKLTITNHRDEPVELEVSRYVLGHVDEAGQDGQIDMVNVLEDPSFLSSDRPAWWGWYNWPHWWYRFNGVGKISWKVRLDPGKKAELSYAWHYFWR